MAQTRILNNPDALRAMEQTNSFLSTHTFQGHAIGCAAALAVQETIQKEDLLASVVKMGDYLRKRLETETSNLKEVRGRGPFLGFEFESPGGVAIAPRVAATCLENGVVVSIASAAVDAVMFMPPFIINQSEVDKIVDVFVASVEAVVKGVSE